MKKLKTKGFTLIELLIVIGILAVLATITIVVLNPAQMFAQARDSQRFADLSTVSKAIEYYLAGASAPDMDGSAYTLCATTPTGFTSTYGAGATTSLKCAGLPGSCTYVSLGVSTTTVAGSGWVPVNFGEMFTGTTISDLPIDPTNTGGTDGYNYSYGCNNTAKTFEINANLESVRYSTGGTDDRESGDGGNATTLFEFGNEPGLDL